MSSNLKIKLSSMDMTIETMKRINPIPILGNEFTENIPERDAFIGILREKKDIAIAIKKITSILPGFGHLKRCSEGRLLLTFLKNCKNENNDTDMSFDSSEKLKNFLVTKNFNLNLFEDNLQIISIPSKAPKTKLQAQKSSKIWPINFHPDPCIESIMSGKFFNDCQLEVIEKCMKICIDAADLIKSVENCHCNGSAVILDPNDDDSIQLLAVTVSQTNEHPLWHAAMLAVDLVAKNQGGGAWKLQQQSSIQDSSITTLRKRKSETQLPLCYPILLKNNLDLPDFSNCHGFSGNKIKSNEINNDKNIPYLCTNYWVFLLNEPCSLCSMALLHSRVSMIFYNNINKYSGVLGSKALLHTLPGLNHRYRVWSIKYPLKSTNFNNDCSNN